MRFPVNNYYQEWNGTAGYGFGQQTAYGFHDGVDINDNGGGNSDLGKPLFAIAKGRVVGIHKHTGTGNFGNHFFMMIEGEWGIRYVHYAHCLELFVTEGQEVNEGYQVAKVGNSGTTYAHCHFSIKKKANGMDTVANTKAQLNDAWEDPIAFIERWMQPTPGPIPSPYPNDKTILMSEVWKRVYKGMTGEWGSESEIRWRLERDLSIDDTIDDIGNGDSRFYNKWIKPKLERLEAKAKKAKEDLEIYISQQKGTGADEVTTITDPKPVEPKTPPNSDPTVQAPLILTNLFQYLKKYWK